MTLAAPGLLFLQIAVILGISLAVARALARIQQPSVVAQMIAGLLLGPSLLGLVLPAWQTALFPPAALPALRGLGQVGVAIFMFGLGLEIDFGFVRRNLRSAAAVGAGGVVLPLAVGALLGAVLVHDARLFPPLAHAWAGVVFFAAAMAVTAFPVMAVIISERGLLGTEVANLCLVCGCFSDFTAWTLLALVLAAMAGNYATAATTLFGAIIYVGMVVIVVRPLVRWLFGRLDAIAPPGWAEVAVLAALFAGAWSTEFIGIDAAFGTFVMGAAMPRIPALHTAEERLRPFVLAFLMPLYFTVSGLNARLDLLAGGDLLLLTALIVVVACTSKGLVCTVAAKLTGRSLRDSLAIGALMNARGLVQLVILTIGLEHEVITPTLYAMMVVMTIVTTMMASPALNLVYGQDPPPPALAGAGGLPHTVAVPFASHDG